MIEKLSKIIRDCSHYSKRQADQIISEGRVLVNNKVVKELWALSCPDDTITIDGKILGPKPQESLIMLNKPRGYLTTKTDNYNRPTIYDLITPKYQDFIYIGRLDYNSEGLLLMTNNAGLKYKLENSGNRFLRKYKVRGFGVFNKSQILLTKSITVENITYHIDYIKILTEHRMNNWFEVGIREGKNREIRNIFSHFGITVNKLIRIEFGQYSLGNLALGAIKKIY